jgi:hypothetical protein
LQKLPYPGELATPYFDFVVSVDEAPLELLGLVGLALLEELLPLLDWSLEPDALGVEDEELELGELGVDAPEELEELGELGVLSEPLALPLAESRLELELDDGDDGEVLAPLEDPERDAPGLFARSQP